MKNFKKILSILTIATMLVGQFDGPAKFVAQEAMEASESVEETETTLPDEKLEEEEEPEVIEEDTQPQEIVEEDEEKDDNTDTQNETRGSPKVAGTFTPSQWTIDYSKPGIALLTAYNDTADKDVYIPGQFDFGAQGIRQVMMNGLDFLDGKVKNLDIVEVENKKVLLHLDDSYPYLEAFINDNVIVNANLSGLDVNVAAEEIIVFEGATNLKTVNLDGWVINEVETLAVLINTQNLESVSMNNWKINISDTNHFYFELLDGAEKVTSISMENWFLQGSISFPAIFKDMQNLKEVNIPHWTVSVGATTPIFEKMFESDYLESIRASNWRYIGLESDTALPATGREVGGWIIDKIPKLKSVEMNDWTLKGINSIGGIVLNEENAESPVLETVEINNWQIESNDEISDSDLNVVGGIISDVKVKNVKMNDWKINLGTKGGRVFDLTAKSIMETLNVNDWEVQNVSNLGSPISNQWDHTSIDEINMNNWNIKNSGSIQRFVKNDGKTFANDWKVTNVNVIQDAIASIDTSMDSTKVQQLVANNWHITDASRINQPFYIANKVSKDDEIIAEVSNWKIENVKEIEILTPRSAYVVDQIIKWNFDNWQIDGIEKFNKPFTKSPKDSFDVKGWQLKNTSELKGLFEKNTDDVKFKTINLDGWQFHEGTVLKNIFRSDGASPQPIDVETINLENAEFHTGADAGEMFSKNKSQNINLENAKFFDFVNMQNMFSESDAQKINLRNAELHDNVNAALLLAMIKPETLLDLSNMKIIGNPNLTAMFQDTGGRENIDLSTWDVSEATSLRGLFAGATTEEFDLSTWDTSKVTSLSGMFGLGVDADGNKTISKPSRVQKMIGLDLIDISNVTDISYMFEGYNEVADEVGAFFEKIKTTTQNFNKITNMAGLFKDSKQRNDDFSDWDVSNVTDMSYMFAVSKDIMSETDELTFTNDFNIQGWNTGKVENMSHMFTGSAFNAASMENNQDTFNNKVLNNLATSSVTNLSGFFKEIKSFSSKRQNISFDNWDTSNVLDMSSIFQNKKTNGSILLGKIDAKNLDTSNVKNMSHMFDGAQGSSEYGNVSLDLGQFPTQKFITSNVEDMSYMFANIESSDFLNSGRTYSIIANMDTSMVTDFSSMFRESKESVIGYNWDTSRVENMSYMYHKARGNGANSQPLNWDVSNVTDMSYMFTVDDTYSYMRPIDLNVAYHEILNLSEWTPIRSDANVEKMFDLVTNHYSSVSGRLIISTDPKITAYDFENSGLSPMRVSLFDTNSYGKFSNGDEYRVFSLEKILYDVLPTTSPEYDLFMQNYDETLIPTNNNYEFTGWNYTKPSLPIQEVVKEKGKYYRANWKKHLPVIEVNPRVVELELNDPRWLDANGGILPTDGVQWKDVNDTNGVYEPVEGLSGHYYSDTSANVKIDVPGVYFVDYTITNQLGDRGTGQRVYVVGAKHVGDKYALFANDFSRKLVDSKNDTDSRIINTLSSAKAKPLYQRDPDTNSIMSDGTVTLKDDVARQAYKVSAEEHILTLEVTQEPTLSGTIKANVYDGIDNNNEFGVRAKVINMTLAEFNQLESYNELIGPANAVKYELTTHTPVDPQPTEQEWEVDGTLLPDLKNGRTGTFTATYKIGGMTATKDVRIYDDIDVSAGKGIRANNLKMTVKAFNDLQSHDDLLSQVSPKKYELSTGEELAPQPPLTDWNVSTTGLTAPLPSVGAGEAGVFDVSYELDGMKAIKTVELVAYDDENNVHGMKANTIAMTVSQYNEMDDLKELAILAEAKQFNLSNHAPTDPQPEYQVSNGTVALPAIGDAVSGTYDAIYSANGLSTMKKVEIFDDILDDETRGIRAGRVVIALSEVPGADFATLSGATVYNIENLDNIIATGDTVEYTSTKPTTTGLHDAVYEADLGTKTLIANNKIDVYDAVTADKKYALKADPVAIKVENLPGAQYAVLSNATVYNVEDVDNPVPTGDAVTYAANSQSRVPDMVGTFIADYSSVTTSGTLLASKPIEVFDDIIDDVNGKQEYALRANNVVITVQDARNNPDYVDLSGATVFDIRNLNEMTPLTGETITIVDDSNTVPNPAVSGDFAISYEVASRTLQADKAIHVYDDIIENAGKKYGLRAENVAITLTDAKATPDYPQLAGAKVDDVTDMNSIKPTLYAPTEKNDANTVPNPVITGDFGTTYEEVTLGLETDKAIYIYDDIDPVAKTAIRANDVRIHHALYVKSELPEKSQAKVYDINNLNNIKIDDTSVVSLGTGGDAPATAIVGDYTQEYVSDNLSVTKAVYIVNTSVDLSANSFKIALDSVGGLNATEVVKAQYANASASWDDNGTAKPITTIAVDETELDVITATTTEGVFPLTLSATHPNNNQDTNAVTIMVAVIDEDDEDLVGPKEDADGVLKANNFSLRLSEVNSLTNNGPGTPSATNDIRTYSKALAVDYKNHTDESENIEFDSNNFDAIKAWDDQTTIGTTQTVDLKVTLNGQVKTMSITVTLITGGLPLLTVTPIAEQVSVGGTIQVQPVDGVMYKDLEDTDNLDVDWNAIPNTSTSEIEILTPSFEEVSSIDTSIEGRHTVTYKVTDSDGNTVTANRYYFVGEYIIEEDDEYLLTAKSFTKSYKDVVGNHRTDLNVSSDVFTLDKKTGQGIVFEVVADGYKNAPKTIDNDPYNVVYTIAQLPNKPVAIEAKITNEAPNLKFVNNSQVITHAIGDTISEADLLVDIEAKDEEWTGYIPLANVGTPAIVTVDTNGWDRSTTTTGTFPVTYTVTDIHGVVSNEITRIYTVNKVVVKDIEYTLIHDAFAINYKDVDPSKTAIIADSNVEVYTADTNEKVQDDQLSFTFDSTNDYSMTDIIPSDYEAVAGTPKGKYPITVVIDGTTTITNPIQALVTNDAPVLTFDANQDFIQLALGEAVTLADHQAGLSITDEETIASTHIVPNASDDAALQTAITNKTPGVYKVRYTVADIWGKVSGTIERKYAIGVIVDGDTHIVVGHDFMIKSNDVTETPMTDRDDQIIDEAQAKSYNKQTGALEGVALVADSGGYSKVSKDYTITLTSSEETSKEDTITAHVFDDIDASNEYALRAEPVIITLEDAKSTPDYANLSKATVYEVKDVQNVVKLTSQPTFKVTTSIGDPITVGDYTGTYEDEGRNLTATKGIHIFNTVDKTEEVALRAKDIRVRQNMVATTDFEEKAEVNLVDISNPDAIADKPYANRKLVGTKPTTIATHDVQYEIQYDGMKTIVGDAKATIYESDITLDANDIAISLEEAQNAVWTAPIAPAFAIDTLVGATATTDDASATLGPITIDGQEIMDKLNSLTSAPESPIELTVKVATITGDPDSAEETINVHVFEDIDTNRDFGIRAKAVAITLADANDTPDYAELSKATLYDISDLTDIQVTDPQPSFTTTTDIGATITTGDFEGTYVDAVHGLTAIKGIHIFDDIDKEATDSTRGIRAERVVISLDQVPDANFVTLSNATVYHIEDLDNITPSGEQVTYESTRPTVTGLHDARYEAVVGAKTLVANNKIDVYDDITGDKAYALRAEPIAIKVADLPTDTNDYVTLSQAVVYEVLPDNTTLPTATSITYAPSTGSAVPTTVGTYSADYNATSPSGALEATKPIEVFDDIDGAKEYALRADNVVISVEDANNNPNYVNLSTATVYEIKDLNTIQPITGEIITIVDDSSKVPTPAVSGDFAISYEVASRVLQADKQVHVYDDIEDNGTNTYGLRANNVAITVADANASPDYPQLAGAKVDDVTDMNNIKPTLYVPVEKANSNTVPTPAETGDFATTYEEATLNLEVDKAIYVYDDIDPTPGVETAIRANDVRIQKNIYVQAELPEKAQVTVYDISDLNNIVEDDQAVVTLGAGTTPATGIVGDYTQEYVSDNLSVTKDVNIFDTEVTITAESFMIDLNDVNTLTNVNVLTAQYANASASWDDNGTAKPITTIAVDETELGVITATTVEGVFPLTLSATHPNNNLDTNAVTIMVAVIDGDNPDINGPDEGADGLLKANNFGLRLSEVANITNNAVGTPIAMPDIRAYGSMLAVDYAEHTDESANIEVDGTDFDAIKAWDEQTPIGTTQTVDLKVTLNGQVKTMSITVTLITGGLPKLTIAPELEKVQKEAALINGPLDGVTYKDLEDTGDIDVNWNAIPVASTKVMEIIQPDGTIATTIDTSLEGLHTVKYEVTDSDGNIVTAYRYYLVGDYEVVETDEYILAAHSFEKSYTQVATPVLDDLKASSDLIAKVKKMNVATPVTITDGGYTNAPKTTANAPYEVVYTLDADSSKKVAIDAKITNNAPSISFVAGTEVVELAIGDTPNLNADINVVDEEYTGILDAQAAIDALGTVTVSGWDGDTTVAGTFTVSYKVSDIHGVESNVLTRIYTVNKVVVKDTEYTLIHDPFVINYKDVDSSKAAIITDGNVEVFDAIGQVVPASRFEFIFDGTNDYSMTNIVPSDYEAVVGTPKGTYPIEVRVDNTTTINGPIQALVTNEAPVLTFDANQDFIQLALGEAVTLADHQAGLSITDEETIASTHIVPNASDDAALQTAITNKTPGVYKVRYTVADIWGKVSNIIERKYAIGVVVDGDTHVIVGHDFMIKSNDVIETPLTDRDDQIIDEAQAKSYNKQTGALEGVALVVDSGGYSKVSKDYTITLTSSEETSKEDVITAHVFDDIDAAKEYALRAAPVVIALDDAKNNPDYAELSKATVYEVKDVQNVVKLTSQPTFKVTTSIGDPIVVGDYTGTYEDEGRSLTATKGIHIFNTVDKTEKVALRAKDIRVRQNMVATTDFEEKAEVNLVDISNPDAIVDKPYANRKLVGTKPTTIATHDVQYEIQYDGMKTIVGDAKATIYESDITLDANDIAISLEEAQNAVWTAPIAPAFAIDTLVGATATTDDASATLGPITIDGQEIMDKLNSLTSAPESPIELTVKVATITGDPDSAEETINVHVFDDIDTNRDFGIRAKSVAITLENAKSNPDYAELSKATLYDITDLTDIQVTDPQPSFTTTTDIGATITTGDFEGTYVDTVHGLTAIKGIHIFDDIDKEATDSTRGIRAERVVISLDQVPDANFVTLSNATVYHIEDLDNITPSGEQVTYESTRPTVTGLHDARYEAVVGAKTLVANNKIDVYDDVTGDKAYALRAEPIAIKVADLPTDTNDYVTLSQAVVYEVLPDNTTLPTATSITYVPSAGSAVPTTVGTYSADYNSVSPSGALEATKPIEVFDDIIDDVNGEQEYALRANNVVISVQDARNNPDYVDLSGASVFDIRNLNEMMLLTGETITIVDDSNTVPTPAVSGDFAISYEVASRTLQADKEIYVYDDIKEDTNSGKKYGLRANNVAITIADAKATPDYPQLAGAKVDDVTDVNSIQPTLYVPVEKTGSNTVPIPVITGDFGTTYEYKDANITLETPKGIYIYDDIDLVAKTAIRANDVRIQKAKYVQAELPEKAQAKVYDISNLNDQKEAANLTAQVDLGAATTAPTISTSGDYKAEYTQGNLTTIKDVAIFDTDVTITAESFMIDLNDVNTLTNTNVLTAQYANASASWDDNGTAKPITTIAVDETELDVITATTVEGVFPLTLSATHPNNNLDTNAVTIMVAVIDGDNPDINGPDEGADGLLKANNFGLRLSEVANITNNAVGTPIAMPDIRAYGSMLAVDYAEHTDESANIEVDGTDFDAIKAWDDQTPIGTTQTVNLKVTLNGQVKTMSITVTLITGGLPKLTIAPELEKVQKDAALINGPLDGVTYKDLEDTGDIDVNWNAIPVASTKVMEIIQPDGTIATTIDTSLEGLHTVKYEVTDSDGNIVTAYRYYLVGDYEVVETDEYILAAHSFEKSYTQVATPVLDDLKASSDLIAKVKETNLDTPVTITDDGYTNAPKTTANAPYEVVYTLDADSSKKVAIDAKITNQAPSVSFVAGTEVVELAIGDTPNLNADINVVDEEYTGILDAQAAIDALDTVTVSGWDGDTTVAGTFTVSYKVSDIHGVESNVLTRIYTVNKVVVKDTEYTLIHDPFVINYKDVDSSKAAIITDGNVEVFDAIGQVVPASRFEFIFDGTNDYSMTNIVPSDYEAVVGIPKGTYPIEVRVDNTTTINGPIHAQVTNDAPVINLATGTEIVRIARGATIDYLEDVTIADEENTTTTTGLPISSIVLGGNTIDTNVPGIYEVTYDVKDVWNKDATQVKRKYIVGGKELNGYVLFAEGFSIEKSQVATNQPAIDNQLIGTQNPKTGTGAFVQRIADLAIRPVSVTATDGYGMPAEARLHHVEIASSDEPLLTQEVSVLVWEDVPPVESVENLVLKANGFILEIDSNDHTNLDGVTAKTLAGPVSAMNETTGVDISNTVTFNQGDLEAIKATSIPKAMPLRVSAKDGNNTVTQTIWVLLYTDPTPPTPGTLGLVANNFRLKLTNINDIDNVTIVNNLSRAYAKDMKTGTSIAHTYGTGTEIADIKALTTPATMPLTFIATHPTTGEVKTQVVDVDVYSTDVKLLGHGFSIELSQLGSLNKTKFADSSHADISAENTMTNYDLTGDVAINTADFNALKAMTTDGVAIVRIKVASETDPLDIEEIDIPVLVWSEVAPVVAQDIELRAKNFTIYRADAPSLTDVIAKDATHGSALAIDHKDNTDLTSSITVDSTQLAAIQSATTAGVKKLKFTVTASDGRTNTIEVDVTITDGDVPEIFVVPRFEQVDLNGVVTTSIIDGVTWSDTEDTAGLEVAWVTGPLQTYEVVDPTGVTTPNGTIDTSIEGIHTVAYTVTDSDNNTATGYRWYAVGEYNVTDGADYVIFSKKFTKSYKQVTTPLDADAILASKTEARKKSDNSQGGIQVHDLAGYDALEGTYNIEYKVIEEPALRVKQDGVVTNTAPVLTITPGDEVVSLAIGDTPNHLQGLVITDSEEGTITPTTTNVTVTGAVDTQTAGVYKVTYTAKDELGKASNSVDRIFVVDGVAGAQYAIFANDFTKRIGEVDTQNQAVITAANAYTVKYADLSKHAVNVINQGGYGPVVNTSPGYQIDFEAQDEPGLVIDVKAFVDCGTAPTLTVTPKEVVIALDAQAPNLMDGVSAQDIEDGDITNQVVVSGTVDATTQGVYAVNYDVLDSDGNTAPTETRIYIVGTNPIIGANYVLFANDFTIDVANVVVSDNALIQEAGAKAYKKADGSDAVVNVVSNGGYAAIEGSYQVQFEVDAEPATNKTITAKVTSEPDKTYELTANDIRMSYDDFTTLRDNGTLEAEILTRSNAKAIEKPSNKEMEPITADLTNLLVANIPKDSVHEVELTFDSNTAMPKTRALQTDAEGVNGVYKVTIKVTLYGDGKLPVTGEDIGIMLVSGLLVMFISLALLLLNWRRRENNGTNE